MDRRIAKTKNLIRKALTDLMQEKTFDKITIKDLTEKADINRATFYLHYKDKYDLLEQSQNDILKEMENMFNTMIIGFEHKSIPFKNRNAIIPFLSALYECIKKNSDFIKVLLGNNGDLSFQLKLKNLIQSLIVKISVDDNLPKCSIPIKYLTETASSIHIGIIQRWLKDGMIESPEELASIVSSILISIFSGIFK